MSLCHLQHIYLYFVSFNGPRSMGIESAVNDLKKNRSVKSGNDTFETKFNSNFY